MPSKIRCVRSNVFYVLNLWCFYQFKMRRLQVTVTSAFFCILLKSSKYTFFRNVLYFYVTFVTAYNLLYINKLAVTFSVTNGYILEKFAKNVTENERFGYISLKKSALIVEIFHSRTRFFWSIISTFSHQNLK